MSLDDLQQTAATSPLTPLAIIAGPGSGKTRTLLARASYLSNDIDPQRMLVLTHTTKAAGEMHERATTAGVALTSTTIHAAAWRQVREFWQRAGYRGSPELIASIWPMVKQAANKVLGVKAATPEAVSEIVGEIDWSRAWLLTPADYVDKAASAGRSLSVNFTDVVKVWEHVEQIKKQQGVLDFADVLSTAADMFSHHDIADILVQRWHKVFVDEYQDVDNAQQKLIDAWLARRQCLTVAGDGEQAIFGFKGGDSSLLTSFASRYSNANVVYLNNNYRSSPEVVQWVNHLTVSKRPALVGCGAAGPPPTVLSCPSEQHEERSLVKWLRTRHQGGLPWSDMAILYRFNATSARLEAALAENDIPYHVAGAHKFFDRPEVRSVLVPFGQHARATPKDPGLDLLLRCAKETGWDKSNPPHGVGPARQKWEAVTALVELVEEKHEKEDADTLLVALQHRAMQSHEVTPNGVALATMHAAKGLEWSAVWVVGVCEGQVPSAYARTKRQIDEEQHLLYVAVSRAKTFLTVSSAARRHNGWKSEPSRFLALVTQTGTSTKKDTTRSISSKRQTGRKGNTGPKVAGCARCGDRLVGLAARKTKRCSSRCLDAAGKRRYTSLVAWRKKQADSLGVPLKKVASDRALFSAAALGASDGVAGFFTKAKPPI